MKRKRKYVVWLYNHTDHRDDEWKVFWAKDASEAIHLTKSVLDPTRFSIAYAVTVKEFRKMNGRAFPL